MADFSVVLFRPDFVLASAKYPMKAHKNQQLLAMPCSPDSLMEPWARGQTIVTEGQKPSQRPCMIRFLREVCSQLIERKALSWGIVRNPACILAEITIRKSQYHFYGALASAAHYDEASADERPHF